MGKNICSKIGCELFWPPVRPPAFAGRRPVAWVDPGRAESWGETGTPTVPSDHVAGWTGCRESDPVASQGDCIGLLEEAKTFLLLRFRGSLSPCFTMDIQGIGAVVPIINQRGVLAAVLRGWTTACRPRPSWVATVASYGRKDAGADDCDNQPEGRMRQDDGLD